jgi:pyridoxal phosphate enzyme (YggS family)
MPEPIDASVVCANVEEIREAIRIRGGTDVSLVAVTKTRGIDAILAAHECGCDAVGENYAQELRDKVAGFEVPIPVHFIGAIQTNKIRQIANVVDVWQSVDRRSVVDEIARRCPGSRVLLQVNTTDEESKHGCAPSDLSDLREYAELKGVVVEGFMTMGPTDGDLGRTRSAFALLRRLVDDHGVGVCSMGMSGDYLVAVDEGSTMVRIGQAIFGSRTSR